MVEVSGRRGHASDVERAKDAQRRNELQDIGRRMFEYTYDDLAKRPGFVIDTMRARLACAPCSSDLWRDVPPEVGP